MTTTTKAKTEAETPTVEPTESFTLPDLPSTEGANRIVQIYTLWSVGAGFIPVPGLDLAAITAANIKMLHSLAVHYKVDFRAELARAAIAGLLSTGAVPVLTMGPLGSLVKSIPIVGHTLGMATIPIFAGSVTYATGQVFIMHFGSGGTLLNFDPESFREFFVEQLNEGKKKAEEMKNKTDVEG